MMVANPLKGMQELECLYFVKVEGRVLVPAGAYGSRAAAEDAVRDLRAIGERARMVNFPCSSGCDVCPFVGCARRDI